MTSTMNEAPFVVSANFCAIRGNTVGELLDNLRAFNSNDEVADEIATFKQIVVGSPMSNAVGAVKAAMPAAEVVERSSTTPSEEFDKYGNKYTYNHPDAPTIPDTDLVAVLKEWTDKKGNARKAFVHPRKGPKPAPEGGDQDFIKWA